MKNSASGLYSIINVGKVPLKNNNSWQDHVIIIMYYEWSVIQLDDYITETTQYAYQQN